MKNNFAIHAAIFILTVILILASCGYGLDEFFSHGESVHSRSDSITDVAAPSLSGNPPYNVAVISDVHFGGTQNHKSVDDKFFEWLCALETAGKKPQFCICLGDVVDHGHTSEYKKYIAFTEKLQIEHNIPTYTVVGNHDLFNSGWGDWKKLIWPHTSFYRFKAAGFSWYFLDTASGSLGKEQLDALSDAFSSDSSPKLVFTHYPLYANGEFYFVLQNTYERALLLTLYAKNNVRYIMDGHSHMKNRYDFGGFVEYTLPCYLSDREWALLTLDGENIHVSSAP